ncbi:MAG: thioredoxin [Myxococcales bacterium]|nr:thioredoxin [Myxococcales bacterium]
MTRAVVFAAALALVACESDRPSPEPARAKPAGKVELLKLTAGEDVPRAIAREAARAQADKKKLVVYVGAAWCEPCTRFHDAAAKGSLDATFPELRLLELDRDRDEAELRKAGCLSRMIPLFAVPTPDGRCSERRMEGSIKGEGAVAEITPRLRALLE